MKLDQAVVHLKRGGLVIYPTETAYGLGADPRNARAVRRIFALKGRAQSKNLPLIAESLRAAEAVACFGETARRLAKKYWPGPLTLVTKVRSDARFARGIVSSGTVAIRVSSHPLARTLARGIGGLIISTSANHSGAPPCYSVRAVRRQFGELLKDVLIVDGGAIPRRKPSTIVKIDGYKVEIVRDGATRVLMTKLSGR